MSVAQLRKLERKSAGDDKRRTKEIDEKIKQTFDEKQEISFSDFLKWKTEAVSLPHNPIWEWREQQEGNIICQLEYVEHKFLALFMLVFVRYEVEDHF